MALIENGQAKKQTRPNIFQFLDLENFLEEFGSHVKNQYGIRELSRRCKISPGYLSEVFAGHKEFSLNTVNTFVSNGILEPKEALYLAALRNFSKAISPEDRYVYLRQLNTLGKGNDPHDEMLAQEMSLRFWYVSTVRKLLQHPKITNTASEIANAIAPQPPLREFQKALESYENAGVIESRSDGKYAFKNRTLKWGAQGENLFLQKFHREMLSRAGEALKLPFERRDFQGMTFLVNPKRLPEMKQTMDQFLTRFYEKYAQEFSGDIEDDSEVFQLNMQLFQTSNVNSCKN